MLKHQAANNLNNLIPELIVLRTIAAAPANALLSMNKQGGTHRNVHEHVGRGLRNVARIPSKPKDRKVFIADLVNDLLHRKLVEEGVFTDAGRKTKTGVSLTKSGTDRLKVLENSDLTATAN
jgi:hypothetical protein